MNRDLHNTVGDTAHLWQQRQRSAMQGPIEPARKLKTVPSDNWPLFIAMVVGVVGLVLFILFGFVWR